MSDKTRSASMADIAAALAKRLDLIPSKRGRWAARPYEQGRPDGRWTVREGEDDAGRGFFLRPDERAGFVIVYGMLPDHRSTPVIKCNLYRAPDAIAADVHRRLGVSYFEQFDAAVSESEAVRKDDERARNVAKALASACNVEARPRMSAYEFSVGKIGGPTASFRIHNAARGGPAVADVTAYAVPIDVAGELADCLADAAGDCLLTALDNDEVQALVAMLKDFVPVTPSTRPGLEGIRKKLQRVRANLARQMPGTPESEAKP